MEVILLERIDKLGFMGEVVKVRDGYARNYLLPSKMALRATQENRAYFESRKAELEAVNLKRHADAVAVAKKIKGLKVNILRQAAETGQLYGSVTARDIRDALKEVSFVIETRQVNLDQPIKNIGSYDVTIKLYPEVAEAIKVTIARTLDDADRLASEANPDLIKNINETEDKTEQAPAA